MEINVMSNYNSLFSLISRSSGLTYTGLPPYLGLRTCQNVPVWAAGFCGCGFAQGLFMIIVLPNKFLPLSHNEGSARYHTGS